MAKTMKLLCVLVIIAMMVVVGIAVPPECEEYGTCIDSDDCQAIDDDSYCYHQEIAYCGYDENDEPLGYCDGIDACSEYPLCYVVGDCPADDGNTYRGCCDVGMCLPDKKGFCC